MSYCKSKTTKSEIEEEVGVFIDSSLGTHIAISVSPHLTASQFIKAYPLNNKASLTTPKPEVVRGELSENRTKSCRKERKNMTRKVLHCSLVEPTSERMSESISVSGIIKKYFSVNDDEVTSTNSQTKVPKYAPNTPQETKDLRASRDHKIARGVGARLVVAANHLGMLKSDKKPVISLCKYKFDKSCMLKSPSLTRHPVFEIGEK